MFRTIIASLLLVLPLSAQDPPKPPGPGNPVIPDPARPPGPGPAPGIVPPAPGAPAEVDPKDPLPAVAALNRPDPNTPTTLNAANLTGQDVADLYFQYTGKRILVSQEASQGELSIIVPGPLTYAEAADIVETKLSMEGYALVPDPTKPNLIKMVLQASAQGVKQQGVRVLSELDDEGPADEFVTYVMALEYLKPDEALRAFQSVVQQFGSAGTVAAVPNAGSVIISGNKPLVRMLVELKSRIDVPSAQVATKFVEVTYADVEELSDKLNEIFNQQRQASQSARVQRTGTSAPAPPLPNAAAAAAAAGNRGGSAGEETPINIIPQPRTSRIFLMGRPVDIIFVTGLISDFDSPSSKRNFLRRKLRYLPVSEFLPVAADSLERTLETSTGTGGASRRSPSSSPRTTQTNNRTTQNQGAAGGEGRPDRVPRSRNRTSRPHPSRC